MAPSPITSRARRRAAAHRLAVAMALAGTGLVLTGLPPSAPDTVARVARDGFGATDRTAVAVATGVSPLLFAARLALRAAGRPDVRAGSRPAPRPARAPRPS